jgi:hypothetical protein
MVLSESNHGTTEPDAGTHQAEEEEAKAPHQADRPPTSEEEAAAPTEADPGVASHAEDLAQKGANVKGEGELP